MLMKLRFVVAWNADVKYFSTLLNVELSDLQFAHATSGLVVDVAGPLAGVEVLVSGLCPSQALEPDVAHLDAVPAGLHEPAVDNLFRRELGRDGGHRHVCLLGQFGHVADDHVNDLVCSVAFNDLPVVAGQSAVKNVVYRLDEVLSLHGCGY